MLFPGTVVPFACSRHLLLLWDTQVTQLIWGVLRELELRWLGLLRVQNVSSSLMWYSGNSAYLRGLQGAQVDLIACSKRVLLLLCDNQATWRGLKMRWLGPPVSICTSEDTSPAVPGPGRRDVLFRGNDRSLKFPVHRLLIRRVREILTWFVFGASLGKTACRRRQEDRRPSYQHRAYN